MNERTSEDVIREMFPEVTFPDVYVAPVGYGHRDKTTIEGQNAIVGTWPDDSETFYGFCSDDYQLVPHEAVIHRTMQAIGKMEGFGDPQFDIPKLIEVNGRPGARLMMQIDFPKSVRTFLGRKVCPSIRARSSYDLGWEFFIQFGAVDYVCMNGMVGHKIMQHLHGKHRMSLDIDSLLEELIEGMSAYSAQVDLWENWGGIQLNAKQFDKLWEKMPFGPRYREEILDLHIMGLRGQNLRDQVRQESVNMYHMYAGITQFITHRVESELMKVDYGEAVARIMTTAKLN